MPADLHSPNCVLTIGALGPVFTASATLIVGVIVAVIAYRQWRVAHEKLILDLFDKRFSIYNDASDAVRTYFSPTPTALSDPNADNVVRHAKIKVLHEVGRRAELLFDSEISARIKQARDILIEASPGTKWEDADEAERKRRNVAHIRAMKEVSQFPTDLSELVARYMKITRAL